MYQVLEIFEVRLFSVNFMHPPFCPIAMMLVVTDMLVEFIIYFIILFVFLYIAVLYESVFLFTYNICTVLYVGIDRLIVGMCLQQMGSSGLVFRFLILSLFVFIVLNNLVGLVPMSYSVTSQLSITMTLGLLMCFGITLIGFSNMGFDYLYLFIPSRGEMPTAIVPFLILIEIMSYFARYLSLGLRLFANMMAGHALMKILSTFVFEFFLRSSLFDLIVILPLILIAGIIMLELGICILQGYVFVLLIVIYFGEVVLVTNFRQDKNEEGHN